METKCHIAPAFTGFFYLGGFDLRPVPLADCPRKLGYDECRRLFEAGWIFRDERDALRVREIMVDAYLREIIRIRGINSVRFSVPRDDEFYNWLSNYESDSDAKC